MDATLSKAEWMDRFGHRLMRLQPAMNAVAVAANAVEAYADSSDIEPEEAARTFLEQCGPDGAPVGSEFDPPMTGRELGSKA